MDNIFIDNDWEDDDLDLEDFLSIPNLDKKIDYDFDFKENIKKIITPPILSIEDLTLAQIKLDLELKIKDNTILFFYYKWIKLWAIEFWEENNETIILDYIWNKNANKVHFEWKIQWLLNWHKKLVWIFNPNFYIPWLWQYMVEEFINFSKNKWYKSIKVMIWSDWLFKIVNKMNKNWLIKDLKTDSDKHTIFNI